MKSNKPKPQINKPDELNLGDTPLRNRSVGQKPLRGQEPVAAPPVPTGLLFGGLALLVVVLVIFFIANRNTATGGAATNYFVRDKDKLITSLYQAIDEQTQPEDINYKWGHKRLRTFEIAVRGLAPSLKKQELRNKLNELKIGLLCDFIRNGFDVSNCDSSFNPEICQ